MNCLPNTKSLMFGTGFGEVVLVIFSREGFQFVLSCLHLTFQACRLTSILSDFLFIWDNLTFEFASASAWSTSNSVRFAVCNLAKVCMKRPF